MKSKRCLIILGAYVFFTASSFACDETIRIDSVDYAVPSVWCGLAIDSALMADPATLVKLPAELCANDYRIYVTKSTRDAFAAMTEAAAVDSVSLKVKSGYRSSRYQRQIILRRLAAGRSFDEVIRWVAPPGYSEHETAMALDLVTDTAPFADSKAYRWLKEHAGKFGFSETYPDKGVNSLPFEPWHWTLSPQ